jgi:hypothetical protein
VSFSCFWPAVAPRVSSSLSSPPGAASVEVVALEAYSSWRLSGGLGGSVAPDKVLPCV